MTETMPTEMPPSSTDLTAEWITLLNRASHPSSDVASKILAEFSLKHGQQLASIESLARTLHPTWNDELSNGKLTRDKMFSLYRQAAQQLDHPAEG